MGRITKKKAMELISLSIEPEYDLLEDTKKSYKIIIRGDKDKMPKNNFQQLVLEKLTSIEQRLDVLESDMKGLKSLPTIQKEISDKNKK